jgi:hypothetical protein
MAGLSEKGRGERGHMRRGGGEGSYDVIPTVIL